MAWDDRVRGQVATRGVLVLALGVLGVPVLAVLLWVLLAHSAEPLGWTAALLTLALVLLPGAWAERPGVRWGRTLTATVAAAGLVAGPLRSATWVGWTADGGLRLAGWLPLDLVDPRLPFFLAPVLVAGLGSVCFALSSTPADARRLRMHVLPLVVLLGTGLDLMVSLTLLGGRLPEVLVRLVPHALAFGAIVAALWPALPGHAGAAWSSVSSTEREWVLELRSMGPRDLRRILLVLGVGLSATFLAVIGQLLPLPGAVEKAWFVGFGALGVAVGVEAVAMVVPRLLSAGRVRVRPAHVVVEREGLRRRTRRMVSAAEVTLRVRRDWQGTLLEVGDGVVVAVDLSPGELEAVLAPVRRQVVVESADDAARARTALSDWAPSAQRHDDRPTAVLEPVRVWHARLAQAGHLLVVMLLALGTVRAPAWSWMDGLLAVYLVVAGLGLARLVGQGFTAFRRGRSVPGASALRAPVGRDVLVEGAHDRSTPAPRVSGALAGARLVGTGKRRP